MTDSVQLGLPRSFNCYGQNRSWPLGGSHHTSLASIHLGTKPTTHVWTDPPDGDVRKVIIPSGQIKEISDLPQQAIDIGKLEVIEAATLKDVYDRMTYPGRIRHPGDPPF